MPLPTPNASPLLPAATQVPGWAGQRGLLGLAVCMALATTAHAADPAEPVDVPITRGTIDLGSIRPSLGPAQRPADTPAPTTSPSTAATPPAATAKSPATAAPAPATAAPVGGQAGLPNPPRTVADFAAIARAKAAAEAAANSVGKPQPGTPTAEAPPPAAPASPDPAAKAAATKPTAPANSTPDVATTEAAPAPPTPPTPTAAPPRSPAPSPQLRTPTPRTAAAPAPQDTGMQLLAEKIINAMARAEAKQQPQARADKAASKGSSASGRAKPAAAPAQATPVPDNRSREELKAKAAALAAQLSGQEEVMLDSLPWSYQGKAGPDNWHRLRPAFELCESGQRQAPIAIDSRTTLQGPAEPLDVRYETVGASVWHTGRYLQVDVAPGNVLTTRGTRYELTELRFQHPGEGSINGVTFPMSVQLWHRSAAGEWLVLAIPLAVGAANPVIDTVWTYMPLDADDRVPLPEASLNPSGLLPTDRRYFQFMGSLPMPPCSEGVLWLVMKTPATLSAAQLTLYGQLFPLNARPPQPTHDRPVREAL